MDGKDFRLIRVCDELQRFGIGPKNLRQYVVAANRESAMFEQALVVYAKRSRGANGEASEEGRRRFDDAFARMQSQVDEYQSAVAEAQTYYSQLDAEVQAELAAQAAAAATSNVGTVVNAITTTQKAQELVSGSTGGSGSSSSGGSSSGGSGSGSGSSSGGSSSGGSGSGSGSSSGSGSGSSGGTAYPCGGVSSAYSCLGYPYVSGGASPSVGFDCGGLVYYCFVGKRCGDAGNIGRAIHAIAGGALRHPVPREALLAIEPRPTWCGATSKNHSP